MRIYHFIFAIKLFYLPSYGAPQHYLWGLKNFVRLHFFLPCYWDLLSHFWKEFWENYFEHPMVFLLFTLQPSFRILQFATWVKADFENQRNDNNTPTYIKALKVTITTQLILSLFMLTFSKPTIVLSPRVPSRNFTKSHPKIPTFLLSPISKVLMKETRSILSFRKAPACHWFRGDTRFLMVELDLLV